MVESIIKETPNARIEGDKLVMRDKKPLPTYVDKNLPSARTWKSPAITEFKNTEESARAALKKGETVNTPYGDLKFGTHIYEDWKDKSAKEIKGRLEYYELAKTLIKDVCEVWQQGEQQTYINYYNNRKGKLRGMVVVVENGNVVKSYFVKDMGALDRARKGILLYNKESDGEI